MTNTTPQGYRKSYIVTGNDHCVQVKLDAETWTKFDNMAKRRNISRAALGKKAIAQFIKRYGDGYEMDGK